MITRTELEARARELGITTTLTPTVRLVLLNIMNNERMVVDGLEIDRRVATALEKQACAYKPTT